MDRKQIAFHGLAIFLVAGSVFGFSAGSARSPIAAQTSTILPGSPPPQTNPAAAQILREVSGTYEIPLEQLTVSYLEDFSLPLTGAEFSYAKVIDVRSGITYLAGLDKDGLIVDPEALRASERTAAAAVYGKLHPALFNLILEMELEAYVPVSIWLDMGGRDASLPRFSPEQARAMGEEAIQEHQRQGVERAAQIHRDVEQPIISILPGLGGRSIIGADTAPLVFAELPVKAIAQVAGLPYVQVVDLVVQGGPEEDIAGEKPGPAGPEMASARQTSKADIVSSRGINGLGVTAAVVEGDSIQFDNPYLAGNCGPTTTCPDKDEHATAVGGILAGTHDLERGVAVSTALLSTNGGGWDFVHHQAATSWALSNGVYALNNSYFLETDGVMHNSDRWLDYIVRAYYKVEVKSAGNLGESSGNITSPGLGFNIITVGAAEDKNTVAWADDAMAELSSYKAPDGRNKPEVTAIGCGEWVTGSGGTPGIRTTGRFYPWIYDQGCGTSYAAPIVTGGAALLRQRNSALQLWPEVIKAILIASALHNIEGDSRLSLYDGSGAVDLAAADAIAANNWWDPLHITPALFDTSNMYTVRSIYLQAGEKVRIAMAYDSNPNSSYTSDPLEGDLDLFLLNPAMTIVAYSTSIDSWEIIEYTVPTSGIYTIRIQNLGGSYSGSEQTFAGVAVWPGHYGLGASALNTYDTPPGSYSQYSGDAFRYSRGNYWNVIGLRSPTPADYDLFLYNKSIYGDPALFALLEDSTTTNTVDFVIIDGNHAPAGSYYPTVSSFSGTGNYDIQAGSSLGNLAIGTYGPFLYTQNHMVSIWDTAHAAGVLKYYAVKLVSGSANIGAALFDSDPSIAATLYQGRSQSKAYSDTSGNEAFSYQSAEADWLGLVVWNTSAPSSFSYMLYLDTTSPTGSVTINSGAPFAYSSTVNLTLSGVDADTGVYQMRFSNNNSTWSAWEAYAPSKAWSLEPGYGLRTVYVQFKNNAEMVSTSFSDSINRAFGLFLPLTVK